MNAADKSTHASSGVDATTTSSPDSDAEDIGGETERLYSDPKADVATGATPGVATACRDLGVGDLSAALAKFNCKPPGQ